MALTTDQRPEVLAWLAETGQGPAAAVDRFTPGLAGAARKRACERVRTWARRARADAEAAAAAAEVAAAKAALAPRRQQGPEPEPPPIGATDLPDPPIPAMVDEASMGPVARLEWLLSRALVLVELAYRYGDIRGGGTALRAAKDLGDALDVARERHGKAEELDRTVESLLGKVQDAEGYLRKLRQHEAATKAKERQL